MPATGITKSNIKSCFMYSAELQKEPKTVAESVEGIFPAVGRKYSLFHTPKQQCLFLHRAKFGENSENVASGISHVKYAGDRNDYNIIHSVNGQQHKRERVCRKGR